MTLKRALLLFWAAYFSLTLLTNVADAAKTLGVLGPSWRFASGNYVFLVDTTARYGTSEEVNAALFAGVIVWEGLAAVLFWLASSAFPRRRLLYAAFTVGLMLWAAFIVADEVSIAYAVEATHWRLFTALLGTLLVVELLPDKREPEA